MRRHSEEAKRQFLGKYPDQYGFLDFYSSLQKLPDFGKRHTASFSSSSSLFANDNEKVLIFHLTDRGFYSEINNLFNAAIYCLHNKTGLIIDDSNFLYKDQAGWDDYFERFWDLETNPGGSRYFDLHYRNDQKLWNRVLHYDYDSVSIPRLGLLPGHAFENKRQIAQRIYRLKPHVERMLTDRIRQFKLPKTYAACHIRRGDKVGELPGYPEADRVESSMYLDKILDDFPDVRTLFVCSDAYSAVEEIKWCIQEKGLQINVITTCLPENVGHSTEMLKDEFPDPFENVLRLMVDAEVSARSTCFVGTFSSNVSRFVALMHANPKRCFSLDEKWHVR